MGGWRCLVAAVALGLLASSCDLEDRAAGESGTTSRPEMTKTIDPVLQAIADGYVARCDVNQT